MDTTTIVLRFIFACVLAGSIAVWSGLPFIVNIIIILGCGIIAAIWGDKFLLGFMSVMRFLK